MSAKLRLVGANHRERIAAELTQQVVQRRFLQRRCEIVDDLEIDAALRQQRERGARLAAARIVVDFGLHRLKCKVWAVRLEPWRLLDAVDGGAYGSERRRFSA